MTKKNYFYIVGGENRNGLWKYHAQRVTDSDNLLQWDYLSKIFIFKTCKKACEVAQHWNYCAMENNNSVIDKEIPPQNWIRHENRDGIDNILLYYRIGHDIKAGFNLNELANKFFEEYEGKTICASDVKDLVTDFLYEYTKDAGIMNIIDNYSCYEGLSFDFNEYNRTHDDAILTALRDELKTHLIYNFCYTGDKRIQEV